MALRALRRNLDALARLHSAAGSQQVHACGAVLMCTSFCEHWRTLLSADPRSVLRRPSSLLDMPSARSACRCSLQPSRQRSSQHTAVEPPCASQHWPSCTDIARPLGLRSDVASARIGLGWRKRSLPPAASALLRRCRPDPGTNPPAVSLRRRFWLRRPTPCPALSLCTLVSPSNT